MLADKETYVKVVQRMEEDLLRLESGSAQSCVEKSGFTVKSHFVLWNLLMGKDIFAKLFFRWEDYSVIFYLLPRFPWKIVRPIKLSIFLLNNIII